MTFAISIAVGLNLEMMSVLAVASLIPNDNEPIVKVHSFGSYIGYSEINAPFS